MDSDKYLVIKSSEGNFPIIKIINSVLRDGRKDTKISFIGTHHHYSVHEANVLEKHEDSFIINLHNEPTKFFKTHTGEPPLVYTSFDDDRLRSTWDEEIATIATKLGLDPERHIKYYENRVLPLGSMENFYLGGRKIYLRSGKVYPAEKCTYFEIKDDDIFLETYFSINGFKKMPNITMDIPLGKLGFYFTSSKFNKE